MMESATCAIGARGLVSHEGGVGVWAIGLRRQGLADPLRRYDSAGMTAQVTGVPCSADYFSDNDGIEYLLPPYLEASGLADNPWANTLIKTVTNTILATMSG